MIQKTNYLNLIKKAGKRILITLTVSFSAAIVMVPSSSVEKAFSSHEMKTDESSYSSVFRAFSDSLGLTSITSYAATWPQADFNLASDGAILIDANSDTVLYEKNSTVAYYPASITKVLTAILVLENCTNLEDKVTFSYAAVNTNLEPNSTIIGAVPGDKLSVRDCLYGLLLHSGNDCANALAEYIAGSNEKFAEMMNQKAMELGCVNSHFVNPSGLNNPEHYTCAYDFAKIMQYAIKNPEFRAIDAVQAYTHAPISKYPNEDDSENTVYAHHHMMRKSYKEYYPGVFAGKTGYTTLAGNTLVTACEKDGMTLICVILNGHSSQYVDTKNLFDFGYNNFKSPEAAATDTNLGKLKSNFTVYGIPITDTLEFGIDPGYHLTIPSTATMDDVISSVSYDLNDDEKSTGAFARIDYSYEDRFVGRAYITLTEPDKSSYTQESGISNLKSSAKGENETVPETIEFENTLTTDPNSVDGNAHMIEENHPPVTINTENGLIEVPKPIKNLLIILGCIGLVSVTCFGIYRLFEHREKFIHTQRRKRMLRHTRDLTRSQKIKRDLLLNSRSRKRNKRK